MVVLDDREADQDRRHGETAPMVLRNCVRLTRLGRDGIDTTGAVRTDSGGDGSRLTSRGWAELNMEKGGGGREEECAATA